MSSKREEEKESEKEIDERPPYDKRKNSSDKKKIRVRRM